MLDWIPRAGGLAQGPGPCRRRSRSSPWSSTSRHFHLWVLSFIFLVFVFINGGFKYLINTMKGRLGERMPRRLRFELVDWVLRFPIPYLGDEAGRDRHHDQGRGGVTETIGDAIVQPVYLGGQAITAPSSSWCRACGWACSPSASCWPRPSSSRSSGCEQAISRKQRQITARQLAGRVACWSTGPPRCRARHLHYERADISDRLGLIYRIRFEIYQRTRGEVPQQLPRPGSRPSST